MKNIRLRIGSLCEKEFIIVMKAPSDRVLFSLTSFLTIRLSQTRIQSRLAIEKTLKKQGEEFEDIDFDTHVCERDSLSKEIKVMLIGKLENPRLKCMRELR